MKPGSTQQLEKLPPTDNCLHERPFKLQASLWRQVVLHFIAAAFGGLWGELMLYSLPLYALPLWFLACLCWPLVLAYWAFKFTRHYTLTCTGGLTPKERKNARSRIAARTFLYLLTFPVVWPWLLLCALAHFPELARAWWSYLTYNVPNTWTAGVIQAPAGTHFRRICWFHGTIWFFSTVLILEGFPHHVFAPLAVIALASLVLAPHLSYLKEARSA